MPKGGKTCATRRQKLMQKGSKLMAKVCSARSKFYHLYRRKQHLYCKNSNQHIFSYFRHISQLLTHFPIISQLLAHCADLSKSEGLLCCCHETSHENQSCSYVTNSQVLKQKYKKMFGRIRIDSIITGLWHAPSSSSFTFPTCEHRSFPLRERLQLTPSKVMLLLLFLLLMLLSMKQMI